MERNLPTVEAATSLDNELVTSSAQLEECRQVNYTWQAASHTSYSFLFSADFLHRFMLSKNIVVKNSRDKYW
jgi:hypothetical protein